MDFFLTQINHLFPNIPSFEFFTNQSSHKIQEQRNLLKFVRKILTDKLCTVKNENLIFLAKMMVLILALLNFEENFVWKLKNLRDLCTYYIHIGFKLINVGFILYPLGAGQTAGEQNKKGKTRTNCILHSLR